MRSSAFACLQAAIPVLILTACGGGGDAKPASTAAQNTNGNAPATPFNETENNSGSKVVTSPPPAADPDTITYTLSQQSVNEATTTSDASIKLVTINYEIHTKRAAQNVFRYMTWDGVAIIYGSESVGSTDPAYVAPPDIIPGRIDVGFYSGQDLGAGIFHASATFTVCANMDGTSCTQTIIPITFTVTGNPRPVTVMTVNPAAVKGEVASTSAAGAAVKLPVTFNEAKPMQMWLSYSQPADGLVSSVSFDTSWPEPFQDVVVKLKPPSALSLGVHSSEVSVNVCIDQACEHPIQNSPITLPVTYSVTASQDRDYTAQIVPVAAADLAASNARNRIYAVVSSSSSVNPESIVEIDPTTGAITRTAPLPGEPTTIALSDDGAYGYVAFSNLGYVERIALATLTQDLVIQMGTDANGALHAGDIAVRPGSPTTLAVAKSARVGGRYGASAGVSIFDNAVSRTTQFGSADHGQQTNLLSWTADATALYSAEPTLQDLFTLAVSPAGVAESNDRPGVLLEGHLYNANGQIYDDTGRIINLQTGIFNRLATPGAFRAAALAVDAPSSRGALYFEDNAGGTPLRTLQTFDLSTRAPLVMARLTGASDASRIVQWGTNGVAFNAADGIRILSGPFLAH